MRFSGLLLILVLFFQRNPLTDAVSVLQGKIDRGEVKLNFDGTHGYLRSLLSHFDIPISSQVLVFSKSNFQLDLVSPQRPRAIYFNDDVYVGWVRGGTDIEVAAVDPKAGPVFYMLSQENRRQTKFARETMNCLVCHDSSRTETPIPRLLMLSVLPDPRGSALKAAALVTNDKSPMRERWGGWYVTGTHGNQRHLGNMVVNLPASAITTIQEYAAKTSLETGANMTSLTGRIDDTVYLSPHSDIAALMVLGHQTHLHNLITVAAYELKSSADFKENAERIVKTMLFAEAAPLTEPVKGTSRFAAEFAAQGPKDSRGRSLRELDLKTRLLRYPLSYLIYSRSFDEMPATLKDYVTTRIKQVLTGQDKSPDFAHISQSDRTAILEILKETKPLL